MIMADDNDDDDDDDDDDYDDNDDDDGDDDDGDDDGSVYLTPRKCFPQGVIVGFCFNFIASSLVSFPIYGSTTNILEHANHHHSPKS